MNEIHEEVIVLDEPVADEEIDISLSKEQVVTYTKYQSIRTFIKRLTQRYMRSSTARFLVLIAALYSCILFIVDSYDAIPQGVSFGLVSNIVVFIVFLIDVIFNIIYADSKLTYLFSFQGVIDVLSLLSILNIFVESNLVFLPLLRLMRVMKIIRLFRTGAIINVDENQVSNTNEAIYFEIVSLVVSILLGWFLAAAFLFTLIQNSPDAWQYVDPTVDLREYIKFFDCLYMILVIISTLGFGDFAPANGYGRAYCMLVLMCAITIIPQQVGQLIQTIGKQPAYFGEFTSETGKPHIVICANLNSSNFQKLVTLLLSQGSNDPEVIEDAVPIALLSSIPPSPQMQILLLHPVNIRKVTFLLGSVNSVKDLIRVKAAEALAILIFADKDISNTSSMDHDDYDTKLKVVSTVNYLTKEISKSTILQATRSNYFISRIIGKLDKRSNNSNSNNNSNNNNGNDNFNNKSSTKFKGNISSYSKNNSIHNLNQNNFQNKSSSVNDDSIITMRRPVIIAQAHSHEVCFSMLNYGVDRIIGINNFKYTLLAISAIYPGFINLVSSLTMPSNQRVMKKKIKNEELPLIYHNWKSEYEWGTSFELMEIIVENNTTNAIKQLSFSQLCRFLYHSSKGTAICVAINGYDRLNMVILNPERRVRVGECFSIFIICNSMELVMNLLQSTNPIPVLKRLKKRDIYRLQDLIDENLSHDDNEDDNNDNYNDNSFSTDNNYVNITIPENNEVKQNHTENRKHIINKKESSGTTQLQIDTGEDMLNNNNSNSSGFEMLTKSSRGPKSIGQYVFTRANSSFILRNDSPSLPKLTPQRSNEGPMSRPQPKRRLSVFDGTKPVREKSTRKHTQCIPESDLYLGSKKSRRTGITPRKYQGHVVLVCAFTPTYPITRIITAIETFIEAIRMRALDQIVILSNEAEEIEETARNFSVDHPFILDEKIIFVKGAPNTARGLESVDVCFSQCVVIIGNEYKDNSEASGSSNYSTEEEIKSDLYILLAALELDALIKIYCKNLELENVVDVKLPFVILEVYNAANMTLLSDQYMSSSQKLWDSMNQRMPSPIIPGYSVSTTHYDLPPAQDESSESIGSLIKTPSLLQKVVNSFEEIEKPQKVSIEKAIYMTTPAFAQGRVFTPYIIDAMTIQMLFNPNILEFWQVLMGMRRESSTILESQSSEEQKNGQSVRSQWRSGARQHPDSVHTAKRPTQGRFDKLSIPLGFEGKTFKHLFEFLLNKYGTIALGLYRNPSYKTPSSYVAILPPENSIVSSVDQVFVIIPGK